MLINDEDVRIKQIEKAIVKTYVEVLGRLPDPEGKQSHLNTILKGATTVQQLKYNLMSSKEYKSAFLDITLGKIGREIATADTKSGRIIWNKDIKGITDDEVERNVSKTWELDDIVLVSTWNLKCGIATMTGLLLNSLNDAYRIDKGTGDRGTDSKIKDVCSVYSINSGVGYDKIDGKLVHLQHEFGIMDRPIVSSSKVLITWHSIPQDLYKAIELYERSLNVVGHIIHNEQSREYMPNSKVLSNGRIANDIWVIPHGSKKMVDISKENARELLRLDRLGMRGDEVFAFVFGFQSGTKNFKMLIDACKNIGIKIVISGSHHECGYEMRNIGEGKNENKNVIFLGKFLNEIETDLFALSSDILLFNYQPQIHYSVSGAMHRVIGARRPCIVSNTRHFLDVEEEKDGVLKFNSGDIGDLERKIRDGLDRREELGRKAGDYAERTGWDKVAKEHLKVYRRYVDI